MVEASELVPHGYNSFGAGSPCAWLGRPATELPGGFRFCVQRPGEAIYLPKDTWHATCNLEAYVLGVGAQGHTAYWPALLRAAHLGDVAALREEAATAIAAEKKKRRSGGGEGMTSTPASTTNRDLNTARRVLSSTQRNHAGQRRLSQPLPLPLPPGRRSVGKRLLNQSRTREVFWRWDQVSESSHPWETIPGVVPPWNPEDVPDNRGRSGCYYALEPEGSQGCPPGPRGWKQLERSRSSGMASWFQGVERPTEAGRLPSRWNHPESLSQQPEHPACS